MQLTHIIVIFSLYWSSTTANDVNVIRSRHSFSSAGSLVPRQDTCEPGYLACSDGGCCADGTTCATVEGAQVCQSITGCVAPPVPCGIACCDAGSICVSQGNQFLCQLPGNVTLSPALAPQTTTTFLDNSTTAAVVSTAPASASSHIGNTTKTTISNLPTASSLASTERPSTLIACVATIIGIGFMVFSY
jgi:hypothetical protein